MRHCRAGREQQRARAEPADSGLVDIVKRELSDIRFSQSETDRHTQDSLEAVHNTLGHVVDRLAMIEGDLRAVRTASRSRRCRKPLPAAAACPNAGAAAAAPRCRRSQSRNCRIPPPRRSISPQLPGNSMPRRHSIGAGAAADARSAKFWSRMRRTPRSAIEPDLPPDHPLEPGTRPSGRAASPSERIAASESAISEIPQRAARQPARRVSLPPRAAPPRPPRPRRRPDKAAAQRPAQEPARGRTRSPRRSPPRSARCWSAQAWS